MFTSSKVAPPISMKNLIEIEINNYLDTWNITDSEVTDRRVLGSRKKVSLQLSSEQSLGNVWIAPLDRKRVSK